MKPLRLLLPLLALLLMAGNAFAWNCSDPLASRVDVGTTQPSGSSGNGDGQWFKGTGSEGTSGHYYVCQVPKPPTDPKGGKGGSKSTSTSSSTSTSGASATGGNSSSTATGGNSSSKSGVSNSGNSSATGGAGGSVAGSGNSNNTNTNTANGGQGGQGGQGGSASATGGSVSGSGNSTQGQKQGQGQQQSSSSDNSGGNSSNSYSSNTNVEASKIPVSTAYAPTTLPTSPCTKGFGGGVQTMAVGGSFGMSSVDKNCVILEAARNAPNIITFCKVYITHKAVKAAGVTLADCMASYAIPEPIVKEVVREVPVEKVVIKEVPVEVVKVVPAPVPAFQPQLVGICTFASQFSCDLKTKAPGNPLHVTRICDDMLKQAITLQQNNPGTVIKLIGNENASERLSSSMYALARAKNVQRRLVALGASANSIAVETGKTGDRTVEVWVIAQ